MSAAAPKVDQAVVEAMCHRSLAYFASEKLIGDPQPPWHGRFVVAQHHEEWSDLIVQNDRVCIQAARGHGKSNFFTLALPLWDAYRTTAAGLDPPDCVIFSASQRQAERLLKKIQVQVENNPHLKRLLPPEQHRKQWSATGLRLNNGYTIVASGYGTKVRGGHPRLIVVDDGFNDNTAYSETVRNKEIDYFFQAIRPMVLPGGKIIVVGTPLHAQDLYGRLESNPEYAFARYPATIETGPKLGDPLWPEVFDEAALASIEREMGTIRFTREYMCKPVADGSSLFPRRLFEQEGMEQDKVRLGMPIGFWRQLGIKIVAIGVDFGLSSSVSADYTVVWTCGVDGQGNRWIMDIYREKGLSYTEQKQLIVHAGKKYDADIIFVESNQAQRIFGEELIRETDLPIHMHHTGESKHSQTMGLPSLRILLENAKYRLPMGDERSREMVGNWITEMNSITVHNGKVVSLAEHDDLPIACWIGERALSSGHFAFDFEEQDGDKEAFDDLIASIERPPDEDFLGEDDYVLGSLPESAGRPVKVNGRLVHADPVDILRDTEPVGGDKSAKPRGYPFGSPTADYFLGGS